MTGNNENILVIKLSALGDFVQALGPMAAIRKHHPNANITLLTTKAFKSFGERCGYFNDIWIDQRPQKFDLLGWFNLRKRLINGQFDRVYDLQNSDRSSFYFRLFPRSKKPEWVGTASGASHRNTSPERTAGHAFDGHKQTLQLAGIQNVEIDDMAWIKEDLSSFDLQEQYVLLVPGSAPQHPHKRWPAAHYSALAQHLSKAGYQIVLLGTDAEQAITKEIAKSLENVKDLTGKTSLFQIAALAHGAKGAIGNDTGPMHIIGPSGCPSLVFFSGQSNPKRHAPKGQQVITLQQDPIELIGVESALSECSKLLGRAL